MLGNPDIARTVMGAKLWTKVVWAGLRSKIDPNVMKELRKFKSLHRMF
jgi:hypothetical protein